MPDPTQVPNVLQAPSILITDDDLEFRETLQSVFEPEGFRTYLAGDGEEALHIVRREEVHLAVLDIHMPKLSGIEVVRSLRQLNRLIPCILLSADLDEVLIRQAQRLEAFSVLPKPVSSQQIRLVVRDCMWDTYHWPDEATEV